MPITPPSDSMERPRRPRPGRGVLMVLALVATSPLLLASVGNTLFFVGGAVDGLSEFNRWPMRNLPGEPGPGEPEGVDRWTRLFVHRGGGNPSAIWRSHTAGTRWAVWLAAVVVGPARESYHGPFPTW